MRHCLTSWRRRTLLSILLAALSGYAPLGGAQPAVVSEQEVKAALVFNFARYVEWPERSFASHDAPIVFCLIGRDRFGPAFVGLEGRRLQGRVVKVRSGIPIEDSGGCQVAYIGDLGDRPLAPVLRSLAGHPVLTVGDSEGFIDNGGAIGIVPGDQRLQFEVNRTVLEQSQLKASAQLLKLARAVIGQGG